METSTRKIIARLEREGWVNRGGASHDVFVHSDKPQLIIPVPRHRDQTERTARSIAKAAGWLQKEVK